MSYYEREAELLRRFAQKTLTDKKATPQDVVAAKARLAGHGSLESAVDELSDAKQRWLLDILYPPARIPGHVPEPTPMFESDIESDE